MLKYLLWASYFLRLCAQTCTPNRRFGVHVWAHNLRIYDAQNKYFNITFLINDPTLNCSDLINITYLNLMKHKSINSYSSIINFLDMDSTIHSIIALKQCLPNH